MRPQVTIGIGCFQDGRHLHEAWGSILGQSEKQWKAIMVLDGGANEETKSIFHAIRHPRLTKFVFKENVGPYGTSTKAFELTDTPYHLVMGGDDLLAPEAIEVLLRKLECNPKAASACGDYRWFGAIDALVCYDNGIDKDTIVEQPLPGGGVLYRSEVWRLLGGYNPSLPRSMADLDFHMRVLGAGFEVEHVSRILYHYRKRCDSNFALHHTAAWALADIIVKDNPIFFADKRLLRRFLARQYMFSFHAAYYNDMVVEAKALARRGIAKNVPGFFGCKPLFVALAPRPIIELLRQLRAWSQKRSQRNRLAPH
jgi:glycosyltransferase involved in cell wall biosynthesis